MAENQQNRTVKDLKSAPAAASGAAPKPEAPSVVRKKAVDWTVRTEQQLVSVSAKLAEIFRGLRSPDIPTRRMSALFVVSLVGLAIVIGFGIDRYQKLGRAQKHRLTEMEMTAKHLGEFFRKQAEEAKHKASLIPIGTFMVELRAGNKRVPGVINLAEVEITLECDSKDTREVIEDLLPKVKNSVTGALTVIDRSELMSREGKKRLKKNIIDRINLILPHGKVEELYFTRLLMT